MKDDDLCTRLEADLQSEYGVDLRDLWRPQSGLNIRRLIKFIKLLPETSRTKRHLMKEQGDLDRKEYLLLEVIDLLRRIEYFTAIGTLSQMSKKSDQQKVVKGIPERLPRPGDDQAKKKKEFNKPADLMRSLGGKLKVIVSSNQE